MTPKSFTLRVAVNAAFGHVCAQPKERLSISGINVKVLTKKILKSKEIDRIALESEILISAAILALSDMGFKDDTLQTFCDVFADILHGNADEYRGDTLNALRDELACRGIDVNIGGRLYVKQ